MRAWHSDSFNCICTVFSCEGITRCDGSNNIQRQLVSRTRSINTGFAGFIDYEPTNSLLTKKMIVFSMAKMAYAAIQFDVLPLLVTSLWIRCDPRLTRKGADFVMGGLCLWYLYRLLRWVNVTINQICERLNVYCFRLKPRTKMRVD